MKTPTGGRFAPASQVPPLSFPFSFSFQFPFNLNYETTRLKTGSRAPATTEKRGTKKNRKTQSASQTMDLVMTIRTVQESSKSELSSRFLSTSKFCAPSCFLLSFFAHGCNGSSEGRPRVVQGSSEGRLRVVRGPSEGRPRVVRGSTKSRPRVARGSPGVVRGSSEVVYRIGRIKKATEAFICYLASKSFNSANNKKSRCDFCLASTVSYWVMVMVR